jgi:hypothetical protein
MGRQNGISHKDIPGGPDISDGGIVYTAHGQMQSLTAIDGADVYAQGFTYNNRMQMITMTANKNGAPVANMTYSYPLANAGRLSSTLNNLTGEHTTYAYDDLMRLTMATASISGTVQWRQTLSYDGFGNMFKIVGTGLASSTSYDSTLDSAKNQMPIGAYQANGNPVGGAFDVAGMKTSGVYQLGYAPDNKRVVRRIYFYSGNSVLGIYHILEICNGEFHRFDTVKRMLYIEGGSWGRSTGWGRRRMRGRRRDRDAEGWDPYEKNTG